MDCAEKSRPRCDEERTLAHQAYTFTATTLLERSVQYIRICGWDKYAGRVLGDLPRTRCQRIPPPKFTDDHWLSQLLLEQRLAVPYTGSGPRHDWCASKDAATC